MELTEFVLSQLPAAPVRVLEVGCGEGELARALADAGYHLAAIDPEAPDGPIFRRTTIEAFAEPGPFDAVVASRSLHHVEDLGGVLDKLVRLLRGPLVLYDAELPEEVNLQYGHDNTPTPRRVGAGAG